MAKKATKTNAPALDATALAHIVNAGEAGIHVPKAVYQPLLDAGMIEVNLAATNAAGEHLCRATPNGLAAINGNEPAAATVAASVVVGAGFVPPQRARGRKSGDRKYPFDTLEVGGFFFVPATDERPEPHISLASSVNSATARYREATGNMLEKMVVVKNSEGKPVIGADGAKVKQPVQVPEMRETRKFKIVPVEAGVAYGAFTAPANGAVIYREA